MEVEALHQYEPSFKCTKSPISPYLMVYLLIKTIMSMILSLWPLTKVGEKYTPIYLEDDSVGLTESSLR